MVVSPVKVVALGMGLKVPEELLRDSQLTLTKFVARTLKVAVCPLTREMLVGPLLATIVGGLSTVKVATALVAEPVGLVKTAL